MGSDIGRAAVMRLAAAMYELEKSCITQSSRILTAVAQRIFCPTEIMQGQPFFVIRENWARGRARAPPIGA
jgi:hypothetical protein